MAQVTSQESGNRSLLARLARAPRWAIVLLCAWGLLTNWEIVQSWQTRMWSGVQDFTALYAGARLVGTAGLYDTPALHRAERELVGVERPEFDYLRLPVVAVLDKPLTLLPYFQALVVWKLLLILGFIALAWLLPVPKPLTFVAAAVSLGAYDTLLLGQDVWLTVVLVAGFAQLMAHGRPTAAGSLLGLAVILKYHVFPLPILVLLLHKKWRVLLAAAMVATMGIAASFAVQGPSWPLQYLHVLITGALVGPVHMPNVGGLVAMAGLGPGTYLVFVAVAAAAIVALARRSSTPFAFGVALFSGVLLAPHGYGYDYSLFLPALLPLAVEHPWFEPHCAFWLMPLPLVLVVSNFGMAGQFLLLMAAAATLYAASRFPAREIAPPASAASATS